MRQLWVHFLPGAVFILKGNLLGGGLWGLAFALIANFAIVSWLIFPSEFSWEIRVAAIVLTLLFLSLPSFLPQMGLKSPTTNRNQSKLSGVERKLALAELVRALEEGGTAEDAFQKLQALGESDLHVAYRLACYAESTGNNQATEFQRRLRAIDRHRIYTSASGEAAMNNRSL